MSLQTYREISETARSSAHMRLGVYWLVIASLSACTSDATAPPPAMDTAQTQPDAQGSDTAEGDASATSDSTEPALCESDDACAETAIGTLGPCDVARCDPAIGCVVETAGEGAACDDETSAPNPTSAQQASVSAHRAHAMMTTAAPRIAAMQRPPRAACTSHGGRLRRRRLLHTRGHCVDGVCTGVPVDCSAYDGDCTTAVCDPTNGACSATQVDDATPCDDDDLCTVDDSCTDGVCSGTLMDCSVIDGPCARASATPQRASAFLSSLTKAGHATTAMGVRSMAHASKASASASRRTALGRRGRVKSRRVTQASALSAQSPMGRHAKMETSARWEIVASKEYASRDSPSIAAMAPFAMA